MPDRVLLADGVSSCVCIRLREDVLTDKALDVSSVAWNLLISNHMVGSTLPVLGEPTIVSIDNFVFVYPWNEFTAV